MAIADRLRAALAAKEDRLSPYPPRRRSVEIAQTALDGGYRTKTGKILTNTDIQELADEAERGYDISQLHPEVGSQDVP